MRLEGYTVVNAPHRNPRQILPTSRGCMFCYQMNLTGEHARACPGKASDIRTWYYSITDRNGEVIKGGDDA
jgi:hypothetical protein